MSDVVLLEDAARDLSGLLAELSLGETVTLLGADEKPVALLVSLQAEAPPPEMDAAKRQKELEAWRQEWEELAQAISSKWEGEQGAVETLLEMRR